MNKDLIIKSNALIEAGYRLSLQEQRIILNLASKIKLTDKDFQNYTFTVTDFAKLVDTTTDMQYSRIKAITSKLLSRVLTINEPDGPLHISWLSSVKYHNDEGKITLRFDPALKPYLLKLKKCFTKLSLKSMMRFKSIYSMRIYELLKQYENIGTRDFLLSDLRIILGIADTEYPKYGNFKAKILRVAKKEINKKTNFLFNFKEIKAGRKVHIIRFKINRKDDNLDFNSDCDFQNNPQIREIIKLLPKTRQKQKTILNAITTCYKKYGFDYVVRNIRYANKNAKSNYRTYLLKALKQDYGLAMQEDEEAKQELAAQKELAAKEAQQQEIEEKKRLKLEQERLKLADLYIESLSEEAKAALQEEAITLMPDDHKDVIINKKIGHAKLLEINMRKVALKHISENKS